MRITKYVVAVMVLAIMPGMVFAQDGAVPESADKYLQEQGSVPAIEAQKAAEKAAEDAKALDVKKQDDNAAQKENESPDMIARKLDLARKMHQLRPTRDQVDGAIATVAGSLPENERATFTTAMRSVLNYNAIEKISVDAMAETFTLAELEAMVEYQSKPEAKKISEKMPQWAGKVQPELVRMIDAAMMRVKTGGTR